MSRVAHLTRSINLYAWLAAIWAALLLSACSLLPLSLPGFSQAATTSTVGENPPVTRTMPPATPDPLQLTSAPVTAPPATTQKTGPPTISPSPALPSETPTLIQTPSPSSVPHLVSELLFLTEGRLARWNHATQDLSLLAVNVADYSTSANGNHIALLRSKGIAANGVEMFNLALLDTETNRTTLLVKDTPRLYSLAISPDGRWIAYTTQEKGGSLYAVPASVPAEPVRVGICGNAPPLECQGEFVWSPDSRAILWSDPRGMWLSELENPIPRLVVPDSLEIADPKGVKSRIQVTYSQLSWSPFGRYVLAEISPVASKVSWRGVIDTSTGRVAEVPDTYALDKPPAIVSWTNEGHLFVGLPGDQKDKHSPSVKIWQILPTRDNLLELVKTFELPTQDFPTGVAGQNYALVWPEQINNNLVAFGIAFIDTDISPMLFTLDLRFSLLIKANEIPYDAETVLWSWDGSGAIVLGYHGDILFAPADGGASYDLGAILGKDAHAFTWLPPVEFNP